VYIHPRTEIGQDWV